MLKYLHIALAAQNASEDKWEGLLAPCIVAHAVLTMSPPPPRYIPGGILTLTSLDICKDHIELT